MDSVASGQVMVGDYHGTVLVYGEDAARTRDNLAWTQAALFDRGIVPSFCDLGLEAAFRAQFPCNWRYITRPLPISSLNFLSFSAFHNFPVGKRDGNPWGPAVTMFRTKDGTPFFFNFHESAPGRNQTGERLPGNTAIFGKTGSGKTVILGMLQAQAQKFRPRVVAFDVDQGMSVALRAMGAKYTPLRFGEETGWNPFALAPTKQNIGHIKSLLKMCAATPEVSVSHHDETEIDAALASVMNDATVPQADRNIETFMHFLPGDRRSSEEGRPSVAARLLKWCPGGDCGWLFGSRTNSLDLTTHRMFGFDVTDFLDKPDVREPLMFHLLFMSEAMIDGTPFIRLFDECWKSLSDPVLVEYIRDKQKTIRKENGVFVFATQEPADALDSPIGKTIAQQTETLILLYNPAADRKDAIDGLKLNETEFDMWMSLTEGSRQFLVKQGESTVIAEMDLHGFNDELAILSGTPDRAAMAERLIEQLGDDPAAWLPEYCRRVREGLA